jgi:hypothetical protein
MTHRYGKAFIDLGPTARSRSVSASFGGKTDFSHLMARRFSVNNVEITSGVSEWDTARKKTHYGDH